MPPSPRRASPPRRVLRRGSLGVPAALAASAALAVVLTACGGGTGGDGSDPEDTEVEVDVTDDAADDVTDDAGTTDGGTTDAGTTDAGTTDAGTTDGTDVTSGDAAATSAAEVVALAEASRDLEWEVTYRTSHRDGEVVVANRPDELVVLEAGEVTLRVTPSGPELCDGDDCRLLLMDAGAPLSQLLADVLGPAAVGFELGEVVAIDPAIEVTSTSVADRDATCVVVPVGAIATSATGSLAADDELEVCVDDGTGAVLSSRVVGGDDRLEAVDFTTAPDPSRFDG